MNGAVFTKIKIPLMPDCKLFHGLQTLEPSLLQLVVKMLGEKRFDNNREKSN
jgi:hypothetical protein